MKFSNQTLSLFKKWTVANQFLQDCARLVSITVQKVHGEIVIIQVLQKFCCIRSKDFSDGCIINSTRFAVDTFVLAIQLLVGKQVV